MRPCSIYAADLSAEARSGQIGPNAIVRVAEALEAEGSGLCEAVFRRAGLTRYLQTPPTRMIDEDDVTRLHMAMRVELGSWAATKISIEAGRLTGDYLLSHRIPRVAQAALRLCPSGIAASLLARAISRNAWTFVGSGTFEVTLKPTLILRIKDSALCRHQRSDAPLCHYYAATFERLFASVLGPATRVRETQCGATGAKTCEFEVISAQTPDDKKCKSWMTDDQTSASLHVS